ncbi:hypothetical protein B0H14DRAFT_2614696 [Mycena olivaceomarginata]|nr:hypothetical protein B0H14DRAFT_2614696 [Mycena olivaceomarginata]
MILEKAARRRPRTEFAASKFVVEILSSEGAAQNSSLREENEKALNGGSAEESRWERHAPRKSSGNLSPAHPQRHPNLNTPTPRPKQTSQRRGKFRTSRWILEKAARRKRRTGEGAAQNSSSREESEKTLNGGSAEESRWERASRDTLYGGSAEESLWKMKCRSDHMIMIHSTATDLASCHPPSDTWCCTMHSSCSTNFLHSIQRLQNAFVL